MQSPPQVFDRKLVARHLERRPTGVDDFVTRLVLGDLEERLLAVNRRFEHALILAPDGRTLPTEGRSAGGAFVYERASTLVGAPDMALADPEALELSRRDYDLIVSILDIEIVNDVVGFLARLRAHLKPDGLLLAVLPGGATLTELRQAFLEAETELSGGATARVAPFIQLGDVGSLVQRAGLKLPVTDVETHTVRYGSALELCADLKRLGAANPLAERPARPMTRSLLSAAAAAYQRLAGDTDGRVRATLELVWLSGWAPHESQQQPLRPGSAKHSLRDVLGDKSAR
jgi:SAM-dependent methyltransferase